MESFEQEDRQGPGLVGRMISIFTAPSETFEAVGRRATWIDWFAPVMLVTALTLVSVQITLPVLQRTQSRMLQEQLKDMPQDERERAMTMARSAGTIGMMVGAPVASFIVLFVAGGVLFLIARFGFGGQVTYGQMLAVWGYSSLVGIAGLIVRTPLVLIKGTAMISTGPGLFLSEAMLKTFLGRFLSAADFFMAWQLVVASIGVATLSRVRTTRALAVLFLLWLVWLVIRAALGGLTGMTGVTGVGG